MDKIIKFVPLVLFSAQFIKSIVLGPALADAPVLAIAALLIVAMEYKVTNKKIQALQSEIEGFNALLAENNKHLEQVRTHVSGIKLGQTRITSNVRI